LKLWVAVHVSLLDIEKDNICFHLKPNSPELTSKLSKYEKVHKAMEEPEGF